MQARVLARRFVPHPLYRLYRRRKIARQRAGYSERVVEHTYHGYRLRVALPDPVAAGWYDRDWPLQTELQFLTERGVLGAGARVFELGAHQGLVALILARIVGDGGHVLAVEAEEANAAAAERNARLNGAENVQLIHAAASDSSEPVRFADGFNGCVDDSTALGNRLVRTVTVDGLAEEHGTPALVFIDVEGYEEKVLAGATRTLQNAHTAFFVEVHARLAVYGGDAASVVAMLPDERFELYSAVERGPYERFDGQLPDGRFFLLALPKGLVAAQRAQAPDPASQPAPNAR